MILFETAPAFEHIEGKVVFLRVDFNVPIENQKVTDTTRIDASLPTIQKLRQMGARIVLASHLGRPKGKKNPAFSMLPVGEKLAEILNEEIILADDCIGDGVGKLITELRPSKMLLLENLRFYAEEENNDENFAKALAKKADFYVNDAFGSSHRSHASIVGIPKHVKASAFGYLMHKEIFHLNKLLKEAKPPFVAVVGGAKVSDKITVLKNLLPLVNDIIIGGAMAYTFLQSAEHTVGKSKVESDQIALCRQTLLSAKNQKVNIHLPLDHRVSELFEENATSRIIDAVNIPDNAYGLDIGPKTITHYSSIIEKANTIFWNGPMGLFEWEQYSEGTKQIALAVSRNSGYSVVGGGDSVYALSKFGLSDTVSFVSTGGGASLEYIENGGTLPGIEAVTKT